MDVARRTADEETEPEVELANTVAGRAASLDRCTGEVTGSDGLFAPNGEINDDAIRKAAVDCARETDTAPDDVRGWSEIVANEIQGFGFDAEHATQHARQRLQGPGGLDQHMGEFEWDGGHGDFQERARRESVTSESRDGNEGGRAI